MTSAEVAIKSSPLHSVGAHNPKTDRMVATNTSPASPYRSSNGHISSTGHHSFSMTSSFLLYSPTKKSPKKPSPPKNGRRTTVHSNPPTRLMAAAVADSNSPLPPSSRLQPATATAPVVGRHEKTSSLVGFDPLMNEAITSNPSRRNNNNSNHISQGGSLHAKKETTRTQQQPPVTPTPSKDRVGASSSNQTGSPPSSPPKGGEAGLTTELSRLAKDMSAASPQRPSSKSDKEKAPTTKFGRATSLSTKFNLTPPFWADKSSTPTKASHKEPLSAFHRILPWQRHRRSKSLETPHEVALLVPPRVEYFDHAGKANTNKHGSNTGFLPSPMMQDLYDVVRAQQDSAARSLALPSLAKPAPTSFLTGTEIVRSSEQDPSPFQMEIPALDQTLVAARLVQFVDTYRKEDMNFDLSMSLVGLPRLTMRSFVETADNAKIAPPNLTHSHKPVVESLLEAADDVTVAGFFATENAGSADSRREAVILERQMQFVVVFRGTTQEQSGKTSFFKKNHKQSPLEALSTDNANCKVYTCVKKAYMELEHRVFECLDRFLDQNPFCDVVFTGSSLGGAMATLGAFRYATNRPVVRVSCLTYGAPKVGNTAFRQQANSLPNLKVMRTEYWTDSKCFAPDTTQGTHVGHSIVLSKHNENNKSLSAVARKFDSDHNARKLPASKKSTAILAAFKKERDITSYVSHLERLQQSKVNKWVKDFKGESGSGVRGKDNEQRQVV